MNATSVGKYFYNKNKNLTEIQIQKLTYYAYVWSMALRDEKIFAEKPQAWVHGPVFRSLYDSMRKQEFYQSTEENIEYQNKIFFDMIYNLYGKYSGNQLENMTHTEAPWIVARKDLKPNERSNEELNDDLIKCYYKSLVNQT